jgi:REP-associated tyrosine transposase
MPRPVRADFAGAFHHVMNRGTARSDIFHSERERSLFLEVTAEAGRRLGLEVHCYCLMSNHYHLLVRSLEGRLAEALRHLSSRFTQTINYRRGRDGPVFRGRFASVRIADDAHLAQASRYIHLNPVTAGLARRPEDWKWSSAAAYVGYGDTPKWLATGFILGLFDVSGMATEKYRGFLDEGVDSKTRQFYIDARMDVGSDRELGSDPMASSRKARGRQHGV